MRQPDFIGYMVICFAPFQLINDIMRKIKMKKISLIISLTLFLNSPLFAKTLDETIHYLQKAWAIANYETPEDNLEAVFETLTKEATKAVAAYPNKAEPLVWKAIIISSDAGKNGGFGALGKVKAARKLLLQAEKIDPTVLNGSIYTSLGSLYYQVPGWPIGFGDDDQAKIYLKKALKINPNGIDSNFFYADFLLDQGDKEKAKIYFKKALKAPNRPNRPLADKGRRAEIQKKLGELH